MPVDTGILRGAVDRGFLTKSVAGAVDVTLTPEEAFCRTISFTGAITANISVIFPLNADSAGVYCLRNATSGAFTLTMKGGVGTGVVITAARKVTMAWIGTDFVAWTAELA